MVEGLLSDDVESDDDDDDDDEEDSGHEFGCDHSTDSEPDFERKLERMAFTGLVTSGLCTGMRLSRRRIAGLRNAAARF
ncbi:hypothetical protein NEUTE2DRAFT_170540 [Neurospora tetrasperma FGSC 2509]|nr:hypothetical protein NEUTE2DRAFT_170540 [Neurospora tetrasperma FGSC 2509]